MANLEADNGVTRQHWLILLVLSLGLAIVMIDATIVNVAIPSIQQDFDASLKDVEWVNSIYSLIYAALIVTWGRIGDQVGRKRIFVVGISIFVLGSLMVGSAPSMGFLIFARAVQGLGAAMASPSTLSIVSSTFTGRMRGVAFGIWGAVAGAAAALGPLLGGWLTTNASWQWAFYINLPIGVVAIVGSYLLIEESKEGTGELTFDLVGIVLASLGVGSIVFGLIEGQAYGWWKPKQTFSVAGWEWPLATLSMVPFSFGIGIVATAGFVLWELRLSKRGEEPLFDFGLTRFASFRFGLITTTVVALGEFGIIFVLSMYLQAAMGLSAFETGLVFLPFALVTLVVAPTAGMLSARFGPKWVVTVGMLLEAIAIFILSQALRVDTATSTVILILMLYGVGMGLAIAQLTNVVLSQVPPNRVGAASGANNTVRQVGAALGIAVLGAMLTSQITASARSQLEANPMLPPPVKSAIIESLERGEGMSKGMTEIEPGFEHPGGMPPDVAGSEGMLQDLFGGEGMPADVEGASMAMAASSEAIAQVMKQAFVDGTRSAALIASLFVLFGTLSSLLIPNLTEQTSLKKAVATE